MTPKEKATELFKKYYCISNHSKSKVKIIEFETARKCVLIAVDEIINLDDFSEEGRIYWDAIKKEIEHF